MRAVDRLTVATLATLLLAVVGVSTQASRSQTREADAQPLEPFYAADQATRGRRAFNRNCGFCHNADPSRSDPEALGGPGVRSFGGHYLRGRNTHGKALYPTVYHLFSKLETMPAFDTTAISAQTRADIAAYLLEANGFPAGPNELTPDLTAMKAMMINEPGFEPVFNGKDFAGIKFVLGPRCKPAPFGCAKTEPGNVLWVENGTIACACHVHGYWYTEERYLDFTLRFDYRFERPPHWEGDDELFAGGSGYLLFAADVLVTGFPRSLEIEGRHWDLLDVYAIGGSAEWTGDVEARRRAMNPLGEWNAIEIVSRNGQVRNYLNGTLVSTVTEHNYTEPGHIAFQSQGARMYWRNIRIRAE